MWNAEFGVRNAEWLKSPRSKVHGRETVKRNSGKMPLLRWNGEKEQRQDAAATIRGSVGCFWAVLATLSCSAGDVGAGWTLFRAERSSF